MKLNKDRLLANFVSLAAIPSPSLREGKVSNFISKKLLATAESARIDQAGLKTGGETGNLLLTIPGNSAKKSFLLCAHMDTVAVSGKIRPVIRKDRITSDGTTILGADCKAGIAVIMEAVLTLKENRISHPPLELLFTISEENALLGAKNLDTSLIKSRRGLVFDNEQDFENIIVRAPAAKAVEIKALGKAAHSGVAPEKGISAIKAAGLALSKMKLGRLDRETTANIGFIKGGEGINIIPSFAQMNGEIRSLSEKKIEKTENHIRKCLAAAVKTYPGRLKPDFEFRTETKFPALNISEGESIVTLVQDTMKSCGFKPRLCVSGGGTDANVLYSWGIVTPILSTGMKNVHTNEEYLDLKNFFDCADLTLEILRRA